MAPRLGRRWWEEGSDPDYRYSLANERTFLAWIRTSLALLAGALAVAHLLPAVTVGGAGSGLGLLLAVAGLLTAVLAFRRWRANERAMRNQQPLPRSPVLAVVAGVVAAIGALVLALVLIEIVAG